MKSLISVINKFMDINPKELVEIILNYKYTKGIEICIEYGNVIEMKYLDDLVFEMKKNNLVLQIHGNSGLDLATNIEYMKKLEEYADYLGYPIVVTMHSIYDQDKEESLKKSIEYLGELVKNIDNDKIIISVENLNDSKNLDRLEKEYITPMILNDEKLYFTYDIGHELADYGNTTNLNEYLIEEIKNIHLHTHNSRKDHQPIYENDIYWNDIMKSLVYLINNNYAGNIVYEYDLYDCKGETKVDKINDYLKSIDLISEKYN